MQYAKYRYNNHLHMETETVAHWNPNRKMATYEWNKFLFKIVQIISEWSWAGTLQSVQEVRTYAQHFEIGCDENILL